MATQIEYAALTAHVYNDQRGGGNDSLTNRLDVPNGWVSLRQQGFAVGDSLNAINPFSFTGGACLNQATGEIVVAYKGTDFLVEFSGRSWNTVADLLTDAGLATSIALVPHNRVRSCFLPGVVRQPAGKRGWLSQRRNRQGDEHPQ